MRIAKLNPQAEIHFQFIQPRTTAANRETVFVKEVSDFCGLELHQSCRTKWQLVVKKSLCPKFTRYVVGRDEWIPLFSDNRILGYLGYLDKWILGYHG